MTSSTTWVFNRGIRPPPASRQLWTAACRGLVPAEALTTRDREHLVMALWEAGWTDLEIACHTRMTLYTTVRIRERIGLFRNRVGRWEPARLDLEVVRDAVPRQRVEPESA